MTDEKVCTLIDETPHDWVTEYAAKMEAKTACNGFAVMEALQKQVETDVDKINSLDCNINYEIVSASDRFTIVPMGLDAEKRGNIVFKRNTHKIHVKNGGNSEHKFFVTWHWNEEAGKCYLCVDKQKKELWEISKMALSDAFFPSLADFDT